MEAPGGGLTAGLVLAGPGAVGAEAARPVWEVTSSPLATDPINNSVLLQDPYQVAEVIDRQNYGLIDIDLDRLGAELLLQLRDADGGVLAEQPVGLATLRQRKG